MADPVAVRTRPRRPLTGVDLTCDWTPYMDIDTGVTTHADCPDCLTRVQGLPVVRLCPDRVQAALAAATRERDDARAERDALAAQLARVENLGEKITRIKAARIEFGLGLKEAKDLVEGQSAGAAVVQQSLSTRLAMAERERDRATAHLERVAQFGSSAPVAEVTHPQTGEVMWQRVDPCDHGLTFDPVGASCASAVVRRAWPRLDGPCPKGCGYTGVAYVSRAHFIAGDW